MPLSLQHRYAVLLADRTGDVGTITTVVIEVLEVSHETTLLDIETALRDASRQAYLVANSTTAGFGIVLDMPAWQAALADAGVTVEQNWAGLSRIAPLDQRTALPDQCLNSAEADVRPQGGSPGLTPMDV